jgi:hypothetical protein
MSHTLSTAPAQLRPSALVRGRGWPQLINAPSPAAGTSFTHTVPGEYWERILSISFTLTTAATVARRNLNHNFMDGDGNIWNQSSIAQGVPASVSLNGYGDTYSVNPQLPGTDLANEGSVTSPAALATIATLTSVPKGEYTATVYLTLAGTVAQAVDANNVQLDNGAGLVYEVLANNIGAAEQVFGPFDLELPTLATVSVRNIALATVGAIYSATLVLVPKTIVYAWQFPDFVLKSGWQTQISLGNAVGGDQLSGIILYAERYPTGHLESDYSDPQERLARAILDAMGG